MLFDAISLLFGVGIIQQLSELPSLLWISVPLPALILYWLSYHITPVPRLQRALRSVFFLSLGFAVALRSGIEQGQLRLDEALAGVDLQVEGAVLGLPEIRGGMLRFLFEVDELRHIDGEALAGVAPQRIRLTWYHTSESMAAGERWRLTVRLKPPHGSMNPGGFDYETWLYANGIHATGYVRSAGSNLRLAVPEPTSISAIRQKIADEIEARDLEFVGIIRALAIGDRSLIPRQRWDSLIATGTNHLMAISGLHIGLAAAIGYFLTRRLVPVWMTQWIPAQQVAVVGAMCFALVYALLAGLSLPTQRALIMLFALSGAVLLRRHRVATDSLSLALILVLLYDPTAVLSAGFWFSFLAVAIILYTGATSDRATESAPRFYLKRIMYWSRLQIILSFSMVPISLYLFQQASLIAPLANAIMIPLISFLVVPLVLLAMPMTLLWSGAATLILGLVDTVLASVWVLLEPMAGMAFATWARRIDAWWLLTLLLILPMIPSFRRQLSRYKAAGLVPVVFLIAWGLEKDRIGNGVYELIMLDVGQGLAVIVRTRSHALVYDTGARFSDDYDMGKAAVIPALRAYGVDTVDRIIVSHADNDHIGGLDSLVRAFPSARILSSEPGMIDHSPVQWCGSGLRWNWDGVDFEILHPTEQETERNNRSCVLKVSAVGGSVLLTGDIEARVERKLAQSIGSVDVITVPHHGSRTSSTPVLLDVTRPDIALLSSGYRNRYRHPADDILDRYKRRGIEILGTPGSGAIRLRISPSEGVETESRYRHERARYWHHQLADYQ